MCQAEEHSVKFHLLSLILIPVTEKQICIKSQWNAIFLKCSFSVWFGCWIVLTSSAFYYLPWNDRTKLLCNHKFHMLVCVFGVTQLTIIGLMSYQGWWTRCLSPRTPRWRTPGRLRGWGTWTRQHYPAWSAGRQHGLCRAPWILVCEEKKLY